MGRVGGEGGSKEVSLEGSGVKFGGKEGRLGGSEVKDVWW